MYKHRSENFILEYYISVQNCPDKPEHGLPCKPIYCAWKIDLSPQVYRIKLKCLKKKLQFNLCPDLPCSVVHSLPLVQRGPSSNPGLTTSASYLLV